jgi:predicted kinase
MRAAIRAKVTVARMEFALPAERPPIARTARGYFALALDAIVPPAPELIAVGGLSGTGKTVLARALAPQLKPMPGAVIVRSDIERKALFGIAETGKLPADAYEEEVTARVYATLTEKARRILAAGHSAIVDAVFADPRERAGLEAMAKSANIPLRGLFLTADLDTRVARVGARARDATDADASVARAQERYDLGPLEWTAVDASGTPAETLARACAALGRLD